MKKLIILIFLLYSCALILHANPVMSIVLSELYFDDNDDWYLELYDYEGASPGNLNYCCLMNLSDAASFNAGIEFGCYDTIVVTNADMQTDFTINRDGDFLAIGGYFYDEMYWGSYSNSINAPYPGQSLARVDVYDNGTLLLFVKENQPSLGYNPFDVQTFGGIEGIVTYGNGEIVSGAVVSFYPVYYSVITDEYGYFCISGMYGMNYNLTVTLNDTIIVETSVTIEPDGTTFVELTPEFHVDPQPHLETISISNHPNPFYDETTIQYSLPKHNAGSITIFNNKGQKIREIPASPAENSITWSGFDEHNKIVPSGVYFYRLESESKTLASGKLLFLR
jgi:hypothetical protein